MGHGADHEGMASLFFLLFVVSVGPLALRYGVDSRRSSDRRSL